MIGGGPAAWIGINGLQF